MWYWLFKFIFMGPLLILLGRPKVEGLEYIPDSGPVILASNHLAVADSFYLPLVVKRRITFLAKSEYFTGTGLKGWFQRWTTETDVTTLRVVHKEGFITRKTFEISIDKVASVSVNQSILGRILNYGDIAIENMGDDEEVIKMIASPLAFRSHITAR